MASGMHHPETRRAERFPKIPTGAPRAVRACGKKSGEIHDELKEKFTTGGACPPSPRLSVANETPRIPSTVIVSRRSLTRAFTNTQAADTRASATTRRSRLPSRNATAWTAPAGGVLRRVRVRRRPRHRALRQGGWHREETKESLNEFSENGVRSARRGASRGGTLGRDGRFLAVTGKGETGGGFGGARLAVRAQTRTL